MMHLKLDAQRKLGVFSCLDSVQCTPCGMMEQSNPTALRHHLQQTEADLKQAHQRAGPVDTVARVFLVLNQSDSPSMRFDNHSGDGILPHDEGLRGGVLCPLADKSKESALPVQETARHDPGAWWAPR